MMKSNIRIALAISVLTIVASMWFFSGYLAGRDDFVNNTTDMHHWTGEWAGLATTDREETGLILQIDEVDGLLQGTITLSDIGVSGWPMSLIEATAENIHIELPSDSGMQEIDLLLSDGKLTGEWSEAGRSEAGIVSLTKSSEPALTRETRVLVDGPAGKIGASIILPSQREAFPIIVFLHGSGPQPRDANRFAAFRFAEMGVASVIYDKRGVGESEGELAGVTFEALAADAIAVAEYVLLHENVSIVGFSGHSQGGWVSTLAASQWQKSGFVMSSSGPAVPPSREAQWTVVRALRKGGASNDAISEARKVIEHWHHGVRTQDWEIFDSAYAEAMKQDWFEYSDLEYFSQRPSKEFSSSYKAFMDYDPIPAIASLNIPYLAILSPDDESIDAVETKEILEELNKSNIVLRVYAGYDHSMRNLGIDGSRLRWPEHPDNYFRDQSNFINSID